MDERGDEYAIYEYNCMILIYQKQNGSEVTAGCGALAGRGIRKDERYEEVCEFPKEQILGRESGECEAATDSGTTRGTENGGRRTEGVGSAR